MSKVNESQDGLAMELIKIYWKASSGQDKLPSRYFSSLPKDELKNWEAVAAYVRQLIYGKDGTDAK